MMDKKQTFDADEMLYWSKRVEAMSVAISALARSNEDILISHGECLGEIVSDYGKALNNAIDRGYWVLFKFLNDNDGSLSSELKRRYKNRDDGHHWPANLEIIDENLNKIELFMAEAEKVLELREKFLKLKKEMEITMKKRVSDGHS